MSPENFCFWAQGFFELSGAKSIDEQQVQIFKDHLALVFEKKTPIYWNQEESGGLTSINLEKTLPPVIYGGVNYSVAAALHPSSYLSGATHDKCPTCDGLGKTQSTGVFDQWPICWRCGGENIIVENFGPNRLITC